MRGYIETIQQELRKLRVLATLFSNPGPKRRAYRHQRLDPAEPEIPATVTRVCSTRLGSPYAALRQVACLSWLLTPDSQHEGAATET